MILKYWLTISLLVASLLLISTQVFGSFVYYPPEEFAKECPVIIAGTITETDNNSAYIRVDAIFKNVLKDAELRIDDILPVRTSPIREYIEDGKVMSMWTSVDIRYDKGTVGIWLIALYDKAYGFTIERNPVQHQSLADEDALRTKGVFLTEKEVLPDGNMADKLYSTDEWVIKIKQEEPTRMRTRKEREERERRFYATSVVAGTRVRQAAYDSGHDLFMWSKEYEKPDGQGDKNRFEAGVFIGYVSGVNIARRGHRSGVPSLDFCTPPAVTRSQLCDVVAKYLEEHPNERGALGGFSADVVVTSALAEAFPCK